MTMCEEYEALISALLDGELDEGERRALEEHLAACPACRSYLADQRAIQGALEALDAPAPEGFTRGVMERIRAEGRAKTPGKVLLLRWRGWALAAAACLVLAAGLWWTQRTAPADGAAMVRSAGGDAAPYSVEEPSSCALEDGLALPLPDGAADYAAEMTTASPAAAAWVEENLGGAWSAGASYRLTEEEYAALRAVLTEAGEAFTETPGSAGAEWYLLTAE